MLRVLLSRQFLTFALVGAAGTAVHYALLILLVQAGAARPTVATTIGAAAGALLNYLLNYRFTFASTRPHAEALPRFMTIALVGIGLNYTVMHGATGVFGWHYLVAQILATGIVLLSGFAMNRLWTFGGPKATEGPR